MFIILSLCVFLDGNIVQFTPSGTTTPSNFSEAFVVRGRPGFAVECVIHDRFWVSYLTKASLDHCISTNRMNSQTEEGKFH